MVSEAAGPYLGNVTTSLLERAADVGPVDGGLPARRAMVRWAWRLFCREWRQQLVVLALLALAVAATTLGAAVGTNTPAPGNAIFGSANTIVSLPGPEAHLSADVAAIRDHFGAVDVVEHQRLSTGSADPVELRSQNPHGPFGRPTLSLVGGHFPHGGHQIALTRQVATLYNLRIGGVWYQSGSARVVVGLVENPNNLLDQFALVAPGQITAPSEVTILFDATRSTEAGFAFPKGVSPLPLPPTSTGFSPSVVALLFSIFGLIFIGLIARAGFAVMAQRRLRALGLLSSLGATDRHVRSVMMWNGAVVGVVGTALGAAAGLAAWFAYVPRLQTSAGHAIDPFNLPWWVIGVSMALAEFTAVRAARKPARSVARLSIVAALSGRPAPLPPGRRTALPGVFLLGGGAYLLGNAGGWGAQSRGDILRLLGGLLAAIVGGLFLAPLSLGLLARLGRRMPIAVRLALRDLHRYRARSGPALSAITFAVLVATLTCVLAGARYADAVDYFGPNLPSNQLIVYTPGNGPGCCDRPDFSTQQAGVLQARAHAIARAIESRDVLGLEAASGPLIQTTDGGTGVGQPYVATPALLRRYGIRSNQLRPNALLVTSRVGLAGAPALALPFGSALPPPCPPTSCVEDPTVQTLTALPTYSSDPNLLITPYAVRRFTLTVSPAGWLIQTPHGLTAAQINTARQLASADGMVIETKNDDPSLAALRSWATAAGILLALGVLAATVGLIRSEAAGELRTLTATGAPRCTRRSITATTAGMLGFLGAICGVAVAYVVTVAYFRSQLEQRVGHVPVVDLALILVGLPLIASLAGWLLAGGEPADLGRQPIE
jgi:putative ABC transport system permease protein